MMSTAALCFGWFLLTERPDGLSDLFSSVGPEQLEAAAYLGLVTTALTSFLQTIGQRTVKAEDAAIIYAMDPVWAAGFSNLMLGETLGQQGYAGAGLLLLAVLFNRVQSRINSP